MAIMPFYGDFDVTSPSPKGAAKRDFVQEARLTVCSLTAHFKRVVVFACADHVPTVTVFQCSAVNVMTALHKPMKHGRLETPGFLSYALPRPIPATQLTTPRMDQISAVHCASKADDPANQALDLLLNMTTEVQTALKAGTWTETFVFFTHPGTFLEVESDAVLESSFALVSSIMLVVPSFLRREGPEKKMALDRTCANETKEIVRSISGSTYYINPACSDGAEEGALLQLQPHRT